MIKQIVYIGILTCCLGACSDERNPQELELKMEYTLPQGENTEADTRIVELYSKFGSYFLYKFNDRDMYFEMDKSRYYELPDSQYVDEFLDFIDNIWLQFYSDKFKSKFLPYRILLAKELRYRNTKTGVLSSWYNYFSATNTLALGYCSDTVLTQTAKLKYKRELNSDLFYKWIYTQKSLKIPDEFLQVSDYVADKKPNTTLSSPDYVRNRGFIKNDKAKKEMNANTAYWNTSDITIQQRQDFVAYCTGMIYRTDADWKEDLQWPLVKQKYDIVVKYFKEEWGFDISKIGNTPIQ